MCVIVYKPAGTPFKTKDIIRCFRENPNGAGLMYWSDCGLHIEKGFMNVKSLIDMLNYIGDIDVVVHFRYATHGLKNQHQTHPFVVTKKIADAKTSRGMGTVLPLSGQALMHNGVLPKFGSRKISDTLDMTANVLARFKNTAERVSYLNCLPGHYCLAADGSFYLIGGYTLHKGLKCSNIYWTFGNRRYFAASPQTACYDDDDFTPTSKYKWALPAGVDQEEWEAWLAQDCYSYMDKP
jgi:hypothetical protein